MPSNIDWDTVFEAQGQIRDVLDDVGEALTLLEGAIHGVPDRVERELYRVTIVELTKEGLTHLIDVDKNIDKLYGEGIE